MSGNNSFLVLYQALGESEQQKVTPQVLFVEIGVGTVVGTCTGTYDSTPLTADDTDIDLTSCSGTLTNGSKYWIITKSDGYNGTNYFKLGNDSTCTTEKIAYSGDGTTWTYATGNCNTFKLYILE